MKFILLKYQFKNLFISLVGLCPCGLCICWRRGCSSRRSCVALAIPSLGIWWISLLWPWPRSRKFKLLFKFEKWFFFFYANSNCFIHITNFFHLKRLFTIVFWSIKYFLSETKKVLFSLYTQSFKKQVIYDAHQILIAFLGDLV